MAIVYRHRRKDTNQIFYIGIGSKLRRAFNKSNRSAWWKKIINKTPYIVEILTEDIPWEDVCELEELLIYEYGRKDLGKGELVNMTNGGEGTPGRIMSEANIIKGRKRSNKATLQFNINGEFIKEFKSIVEAGKAVNAGLPNISAVCKGKKLSAGGYVWRHKTSSIIKNIDPISYNRGRPIRQLTLDGVFIREFNSIKEASEMLGKKNNNIGQVCAGSRKKALGFKWEFKINK